MLQLQFPKRDSSVLKILCLGAHSDDIEIGCGGTLCRLIQELQAVEIYWVVFSASPERAKEAKVSADLFLNGAQKSQLVIKNFRDSFFPYMGSEVKEYFQEIRQEFTPDLIFTHHRHDLHQDHRLLCELTWNTFRDHLILEYEIPKYEGDLGHPNFYVPLSQSASQRKVENLWSAFQSQRSKAWFSPETFNALLRLRGIESNAPEGYAEAFHCRKIVL
jgi:LmbE family N-acetylglucosaminyl deacetylase